MLIVFILLQNNNVNNVEIIIKENRNKEELTNILLDYDANQIIDVLLKDNDILITLHNDNGSKSILKLADVYFPSHNDKEKTLTANYIFIAVMVLYSQDYPVLSFKM